MDSNKLKLCSDIYDAQIINYAIEKYKEIAKISMILKDKYYICLFSDCKYDITETKYEFENFIIHASNSKELT